MLKVKMMVDAIAKPTMCMVAAAVLTLLTMPPTDLAAQQAEKMYRIGYLRSGNPGTFTTKAFVQELRKLGYEEGRNITIDSRFAKSRNKLLPGMAAELVRQKPDVMVVCCGPAIDAAQKATNTIPIVVAIGGNYVERGLVKSLRRPGGNLTGLSSISSNVVGKQLQLFKETVPGMSRVAVLHPVTHRHGQHVKKEQEAAKSLGLELVHVEVGSPDDFPTAFRRIERAGVDALFVRRSGLIHRHKHLTTKFANEAGLPTMFGHRQEAEAGGLMAYGTDVTALFQRTAHYVDKIFKGANPAEMPIERPAKFNFVVNLKTAKALGVTIPPSILLRATTVIE
jgi:putative ABC transport system substrate-binding protein